MNQGAGTTRRQSHLRLTVIILAVLMLIICASILVQADDDFVCDFDYDIDKKRVQFTYNGSEPSAITWSFGDGFSSHDINPGWIYDDYGEYTVTVKATDKDNVDHYHVELVVVQGPFLDLEEKQLNVGANFSASAVLLIGMGAVIILLMDNGWYWAAWIIDPKVIRVLCWLSIATGIWLVVGDYVWQSFMGGG